MRAWHQHKTTKVLEGGLGQVLVDRSSESPPLPPHAKLSSTTARPLPEVFEYPVLGELGAPPLLSEDIDAVGEGSLGDAVQFLAKHLQGRQKTFQSRKSISRYYISERPMQIDNPEKCIERLQQVTSRLRTTQQDIASLQGELNSRQANLTTLQAQNDALENKLDQRRSTKLFLSALEKREVIRSRRIGELTRQIQQIRQNVSAPDSDRENAVSPCKASVFPTQSFGGGRVRDSLASLRAHHIHLFRLATNSEISATSDLEARLVKAISGFMELPPDDERVTAKRNEFLRVARRTSMDSLNLGGGIEKLESAPVAGRVGNKQRRLQQKSNELNALRISCSELLDLLETYATLTIPVLFELFEDDKGATEGYLDLLCRSIVDRSSLDVEGLDARGDYGKATTNEVGKNIHQAHQLTNFNYSTQLNDNPSGGSDPIKKYESQESDAHLRVSKLLSRKVEKSKLSNLLVTDIEGFIKEKDLVASLN